MRIYHIFLPLLLVVPLTVSAAPPQNFAELVNVLIGIINPIFSLVIGAIVLMFLFGLAKFAFSLGNTESLEQGRQFMFWGIVALFIAFAFWGLVAILSNTFLT